MTGPLPFMVRGAQWGPWLREWRLCQARPARQIAAYLIPSSFFRAQHCVHMPNERKYPTILCTVVRFSSTVLDAGPLLGYRRGSGAGGASKRREDSASVRHSRDGQPDAAACPRRYRFRQSAKSRRCSDPHPRSRSHRSPWSIAPDSVTGRHVQGTGMCREF